MNISPVAKSVILPATQHVSGGTLPESHVQRYARDRSCNGLHGVNADVTFGP